MTSTTASTTATPVHAPGTNLVELRGVSCGYGDRVILRDVNLKLPRGKVIGLMGTSGGGKTTVLRLIGRQIEPIKGQVLFDGVDLADLDREALYAVRRRMGLLFQFGALFTDLSVFDNVAFPLREHTRLNDAMVRDLVLMKLNAVGLRGARDLHAFAGLRGHGTAGGLGPGNCPRSGPHHVRRTLCRAGPHLHGHGGASDP